MGKGKAKALKEKEDRSKKVYRQFSREKYGKYKRQFPRMRQSQIVSKIIREWEALDQQGKQKLQENYIQRGGTDFFKSGSSSLSKNKSKSKSKSKSVPKDGSKLKPFVDAQISSKKTPKEISSGKMMAPSSIIAATMPAEKKPKKKKSPQVRVFEEKKKSPKRQSSDFKRSGSKSLRKYDSSDEVEREQFDKGKDTKKSSAYHQFYKYYYERLSAEHPRWSSNQITTIIKLLWKKRSKQSKKGDLSKRIRKGTEKIISGWQYYRKIKENEGLTRLTIKEMWKKLPIESKRFYKIQGMGNIRRPKRTSGSFVRKVLNAGAMKTESLSGIVQRDYGWMWHQIN